MQRKLTQSPPHPFRLFERLQWLDGRPLMDTIEPYRQKTFSDVLYSFDGEGTPRYNLCLVGRAKKNWKSCDLILAALYRLLVHESPHGNDGFVLANDEEQAGDDLSLAKKLINCNPLLARELDIERKRLVRKDGRGTLQILPARDVVGSHGKTYGFIGYDEIHGFRDYNLLEALSPDPTRDDVLTWITSYAGINHVPGIPLYDYMQRGKRGDDPRMYFSWYAGDFGTDPAFADLPTPEERANPSIQSWRNSSYLETQKQRLPSSKYRRLHLNLPGAPEGAAFSTEHVMAAIVANRRRLPPVEQTSYSAFVDMSGGSNDDAVLAVAHIDDTNRVVLDLCISQTGKPPFNPRDAVRKFAALLQQYNVHHVTGDHYAGETFRADFAKHSIIYQCCDVAKHDLYEALEPKLNAGEVELLDGAELQEQLLTLVWRGRKIDHMPGDHDDFANAAAGAIWLAAGTHHSLAVWAKCASDGSVLMPAWAKAGMIYTPV